MTNTTLASEMTSTLTADQVVGWLDAYGRAWETRDGDAAAALFGDRARYEWGPFAPPLQGRAAIALRWAAATCDQRDIRFGHQLLAISGGHAFVHWRATFERLSTGARTELDGVFVLHFSEHGMCTELREWWLERKLPRTGITRAAPITAGDPAGPG